MEKKPIRPAAVFVLPTPYINTARELASDYRGEWI